MCSCSMVRSYSYLYYRNLLSEFIFFIALYSVSCVNIKRSDHSTTTCSHFYRVEPRYLELPAISNLNPFPLELPLLFQSFILAVISNSVISNSPLSRTIFCFPWPKSIPVISNIDSNDEVDEQTSESVRTQLECVLKRH